MNRVVHFEIPADDTGRASAFYTKVFGWKFNDWSGGQYLLIDTGDENQPGINGGMLKKQAPSQPVACTIDVADVDASLKIVVESGGTVALPKMAVPGVGWVAYFVDTEKNLFGMMQVDKAGK